MTGLEFGYNNASALFSCLGLQAECQLIAQGARLCVAIRTAGSQAMQPDAKLL
jgi:uncharacterized protein with beta-barrel porin domain